MRPGKKLAGIKKIAVVRVNSLGDFIFAVPALNALNGTYPHAEITYLGKQWHADFAPGRVPAIGKVVAVPAYPGVGGGVHLSDDTSEIKAFFEKMQAERFDLAVQLHGGGRFSNPFTKLLGARFSIGLQDYDAVTLDLTVPYVYYQNEVMRCLETVSLVGAKATGFEPKIKVLSQDRQEAARVAKTEGKPYVILHPGSSDPRRQWPPENFAATARELLKADFNIYVTGNQAETALAQAIIKYTGSEVVNLCGQLSLPGLAALLSQAALVISNDTGPLHLAHAVGAKTIGIYWWVNLLNGGPLTRTRHRPLFSSTLHCPVCGAFYGNTENVRSKPCGHKVSFVGDVSVEAVLSSARDLLKLEA